MPLTRLKSLQGGAATPLAYKILCVRFTSVVHVCYSVLSIGNAVRQRRNTRYGWLARPYPTETCTQQETRSFAWRTNDRL
jgi:hypothetical protein